MLKYNPMITEKVTYLFKVVDAMSPTIYSIESPIIASLRVSEPNGSGLDLVRFMMESISISIYIFSAVTPPTVPIPTNNSVSTTSTRGLSVDKK